MKSAEEIVNDFEREVHRSVSPVRGRHSRYSERRADLVALIERGEACRDALDLHAPNHTSILEYDAARERCEGEK